ncbi:M10 family metallopeptidase C-terminal domain-containing protein [Devosia rhodophyticola]|uniref:M10 family metallopeptidase C-terminal domain-containing protein n=1 Tax=Devosia rhodophyticola TaxID=3026423 RepID=A0ABY7YXY0_9HYPH|nr:M10 family metallopeptidase C-terminal domain-containing protein [Devosia rhodophyticola]WDR06243.1 M10 family metallopeptidase C-terminal domain-containing protein [Devosia rhodophyticola]
MAGWPDSTNTGVPDGVTLLPSGSIIVTKPGTVISGLDIKGNVYIDADNVTLENCRITSTNFSVVQIKDGNSGVVVQNCEINGVGSGNEGSNGITGVGTFLNNDIYNVENGIAVGGGSGTVIEGNYIHDLKASGSPHYDGIQIDGGQSDILIRNNTVINDHGQTAAVMIDNWFGPVSNVVLENNILVGGGYTIYSDGQFNGGSISGVQIINNHIGGGYWGDLNTNGNTPVYTGNVDDGESIVQTLNGNGNDTSGGPEPTQPPVEPTQPPVEPTQPPVTEPVQPPVTEPVQPTQPPVDNSSSATQGDDVIFGDALNNVFNGLGGNDIIDGGAGVDTLTGGAGADIFAFSKIGDIGMRAGARDVITDFTQGQDKIDVSALDANAKLSGHQGFSFLADDDAIFTKTPGELAWHTEADKGITVVQGDIDGDGWHDFEFEIKGTTNLKASDFIGVEGSDSGSQSGGSSGGDGTVQPPVTTPTVPPVTPTTPETAPEGNFESISGTWRSDRLDGGADNDHIEGLGGNDRLDGRAGDDIIDGGAGRDIMTGGSGSDIFQFKSLSDMGSTSRSRDVIRDFEHGQDKIDLSALDANSTVSGNQEFAFLAQDDQLFNRKAGELAWHTEGRNTIIQGDINGDGIHDFEIQLRGHIALDAGDFIL